MLRGPQLLSLTMTTLCSAVVGLVFLIGAATKLLRFHEFKELLRSYGLVPGPKTAFGTSVGIVAAEIGLGACLPLARTHVWAAQGRNRDACPILFRDCGNAPEGTSTWRMRMLRHSV